MSRLLPSNFHGSRYGLTYRLVNEDDSVFILSLRTDAMHARYIHSTDNDLAKQIEWIKAYKEREKQGKDYYFIFYQNNQPIGVSRVYNVSEYFGTAGSWICKPNCDPNAVLASYMILHDIMFEDMGLDLSIFDVRKDNKKVRKTHILFGAMVIGESDIDTYYSLFKKTYIENRERLKNFLNK